MVCLRHTPPPFPIHPNIYTLLYTGLYTGIHPTRPRRVLHGWILLAIFGFIKYPFLVYANYLIVTLRRGRHVGLGPHIIRPGPQPHFTRISCRPRNPILGKHGSLLHLLHHRRTAGLGRMVFPCVLIGQPHRLARRRHNARREIGAGALGQRQRMGPRHYRAQGGRRLPILLLLQRTLARGQPQGDRRGRGRQPHRPICRPRPTFSQGLPRRTRTADRC